MADFFISIQVETAENSGIYEPISTSVWDDPASGDRPSRIAPTGDQQHRYITIPLGRRIIVNAYRYAAIVPNEPDSSIGKYSHWAIEYPELATKPLPGFPVFAPPTSSVVRWTFDGVGHYLLGIRHEDTLDAPFAAAGGAIYYHLDVVTM